MAIRLGGQVQETKAPNTVSSFVNCLGLGQVVYLPTLDCIEKEEKQTIYKKGYPEPVRLSFHIQLS